MRVADAAGRFRDFVEQQGVDIEAADASQLVRVMVAWYVQERADDVEVQADGDMLLFQWDIYDWGAGPAFQYDITRQLIDANDPDEDGAIWQLSVTAHFPAAVGSAVESGDRWCGRPDDVTGFQSFIDSCDATGAVRGLHPSHVDVRFRQAG